MTSDISKAPLSMKKIQKVSLEILKFVAELCERLNLRYYLMYGTLIGAIRHNGYIPWDDDVDIMMPRPDYEKLLNYLKNHRESMGFYEVFNRDTCTDYNYAITRISDSRYEINKSNERDCGMGIFIDIYPYDGLGDNKESALKMLSKTRIYCDRISDLINLDIKIPDSLNLKGRIVWRFNRWLNKLRGVGYFHNKLKKLVEGKRYDESKYVGPLLWYFSKPEKVLFPKEYFDNPVKVKFEDGEFWAPSLYNELLTQEYGDYMKMPPVEKRVYHHQYFAYKK